MNKILSFECGPVATNCYLVGNDATGVAVLIDAPKDCLLPVTKALEEHSWTLTDILLTHTHWDHTADCYDLQKCCGARVFVHELDVYRLKDPMAFTTIMSLSFEIPPVHDFIPVGGPSGSLVIGNGNHTIEWVHTPGHTEGGICFLDRPRGVAFVGDTLFAGSIGRTDLPGGDMDTLCASIRDVLFPLDGETIALPGHGPSTTIEFERLHNPFVGDAAR